MPGATLRLALETIEQKVTLHTSLKEGFHKLYLYLTGWQEGAILSARAVVAQLRQRVPTTP